MRVRVRVIQFRRESCPRHLRGQAFNTWMYRQMFWVTILVTRRGRGISSIREERERGFYKRNKKVDSVVCEATFAHTTMYTFRVSCTRSHTAAVLQDTHSRALAVVVNIIRTTVVYTYSTKHCTTSRGEGGRLAGMSV